MSPHVIIEGMETVEAWDQHKDAIIARIEPDGDLDKKLAERLAGITWRLRRVIRYETAAINHQVVGTANDLRLADTLAHGPGAAEVPIKPLRLAAYKELRVIPGGPTVEKILKYETHLHRQCLQLLHEIEALHARRRGETTPLARVDFSS